MPLMATELQTIGHSATSRALERSSAQVERLAVAALLAVTAFLSIAYAGSIPWGEAPDEPSHLRYVEHLVRFGTLPYITPEHPYTDESQQPPLYYALGAVAVLSARLATGEQPLNAPFEARIAANPDVYDRSKQPVANVFIHAPDERLTTAAILMKGLSVLMSVIAVALVYMAARRLVPPPAPPLVPLAAASFFAFVPQRLFMSGAVANENLSTMVSAWLCLLLITHLTNRERASDAEQDRLIDRSAKLLGLAFGVGILSKFTVGTFVFPLVWALWVARGGDWRRFARDLLWFGGIVVLLAGPLFAYNILTYGDPLAQTAVARMLPANSHFRLADLFWLKSPFFEMLWTSFWAVFGWQRIYMPDWFYDVWAVLTVAAVAGGVRLLLTRALSGSQRLACAALLAHALLIYAAIVLYSLRLIAWQGRELFPSLPGLSVLAGLGLVGLFVGRAATQASPESAEVGTFVRLLRTVLPAALVLLLAAGLLALNLFALTLLRESFGLT